MAPVLLDRIHLGRFGAARERHKQEVEHRLILHGHLMSSLNVFTSHFVLIWTHYQHKKEHKSNDWHLRIIKRCNAAALQESLTNFSVYRYIISKL